MYNVGPDFTRPATSASHCSDCGENVQPEWDGCEGGFRCPQCFEPMPDYDEAAAGNGNCAEFPAMD